MLVNVDDDETRIAAVTGNTLDNLHVEQTGRNRRQVGNIYRGKVVKVQNSFQAAFVDYGGERQGFLAFSDVNFQIFKSTGNPQSKSAIRQFLKPGQWIMVQVTRNELGNKGPTLTTHINLPGRFIVFMPNSSKGGVSKKIDDVETRVRLKNLLEGLCSEKDSAIIRTAGVNRSASELKRDYMVLRRKWNEILIKYESSAGAGLLYEEEDVVVRTLRDYFIDDIAEIWIDHPETFQRALEFFKSNIPGRQKRLQFYLGERSLFSDYGVENQIEQLSSNHVPLPSGGSLVIDPTEALVAIDVNSGRYNQANDIEETALLTNQEAAEEIARQLRLRNLGGLIVIDFVDMVQEENRITVAESLREWMQEDKAKWKLGTISQFGLLEMSRQRIANALSQEMKTTCPACGGIGEVLSVASLANAVLRKIRDLSATSTRESGEILEIHSHIPVELSNHLFNKKRQQLDELEVEFGINIILTADLSCDPGKLPDFEVIRKTVAPSEKMRASGKIPLPEEEDSRRKEKEEKVKPGKDRRKKAKSSGLSQTAEVREKSVSAVDSADDRMFTKENESTTALKSSSPLPLYSSAHQPPPAERAGGVPLVLPSRKVSVLHERAKDIPPGTVLFSSSHRDSLEDLTPGNKEELVEDTQTTGGHSPEKDSNKKEADEESASENTAKEQSPAQGVKKKATTGKKTTTPGKKSATTKRRSTKASDNVEKTGAEPVAGIAGSEATDRSTELLPAKPSPAKKSPPRKSRSASSQTTHAEQEKAGSLSSSEKISKPAGKGTEKEVKDSPVKKAASQATSEKASKEPVKKTVQRKSKKSTTSAKTESLPEEKASKKNKPTPIEKVAVARTTAAGNAVRRSGKK